MFEIFLIRQPQALAEISDDLDADADPELVDRAANFFIENSQMV